MRALKNFFSVNSVIAKSALLVRRFPISVLLAAVLEYLIFGVVDDNDFRRALGSYRLYLFLSIGVFISAAAALWLEDIVDSIRQYLITAVIVSIWGVYCSFLPVDDDTALMDYYTAIMDICLRTELIAIAVVAFLSMFFISFLKKGTDKPFCNFTVLVVFRCWWATFIGQSIFYGLCGALLAVTALFGVNITSGAYWRLASVCFVLFVPLYILANIPGKDAKHSEDTQMNKYARALGLYVLAPLAAVYAVILYVYLFKIIFTWELPKGLVSWLVSSLACGGFLIVTILYPARMEERNKVIVGISRYFGLAMLPLLALMTVGIFRRVSDYGFTVMRCYLILINVWLYAICLYHFIAKARRVKFVVVSFAAVALLSSVRFCGVPVVAKHILIAEINGYTNNKKISMADTALFNKLGRNKREKAVEKLQHLRDTYGFESVQALFENDVNNSNFYEFSTLWKGDDAPEPDIKEDLITADAPQIKDDDAPKSSVQDTGISFSFNSSWRNYTLHFENYNAFAIIDYPYPYSWDDIILRCSFENNQLIVNSIKHKRAFHIPLKQKILPPGKLSPTKHHTMYLESLKNDDENWTILINEYSGKYYKSSDSITLEHFKGYLFYNQ